MVVLILVSVKRPVTRAGLMSNVVPLPLPVEMFAVKEVRVVPPLKPPLTPITHDAPVPLAVKLPLDCAKVMGATANAIANAIADIFNFIIWFSSNFGCKRSNLNS
jgi:hypothetical protein